MRIEDSIRQEGLSVKDDGSVVKTPPLLFSGQNKIAWNRTLKEKILKCISEILIPVFLLTSFPPLELPKTVVPQKGRFKPASFSQIIQNLFCAEAFAANLVTSNGDFETGNINGWTAHQVGATVSNTVNHTPSGTYSAKPSLQSDNYFDGWLTYNTTFNLPAGSRIYASAWIKTENLRSLTGFVTPENPYPRLPKDAPPGAYPPVYAFIRLDFIGSGAFKESGMFTGTNDWSLASIDTTVPPGTTGIKVSLKLWNNGGIGMTGTAYFDDAFVDVAPPAYVLPEAPIMQFPGLATSVPNITLTWSAKDPTIVHYEFMYDNKSDFSGTPVTVWTDATSYNFTFPAESYYYFKVRGWDGAKTKFSDWSNFQYIIYLPRLAQVANLGNRTNTLAELSAKLDSLATYFGTQDIDTDTFLNKVFADTLKYFQDANIHNTTYGFPRAGYLPNQPVGLFAGTGSTADVYISNDDGANWAKTTISGNTKVNSLFIFNGVNLYAGTSPNGKVFLYNTSANTWTEKAALTGATDVYCFATLGHKLYAGTGPNGDVFKYDTETMTWTNTGDLAGATKVYSIINVGYDIYAGTGPNGDVFRYNQWDNTWTKVATLSGATDVYALMYTWNNILFAATGPSGKVFKSTNLGSSWTLSTLAGATDVRSIITNFYGSGQTELIAGTGPNGKVFSSQDNGDTWTDIALTGVTEVSSLASYKGYIYAGTKPNGDVFKYSKDFGWSNAGIGDLNGATEVHTLVGPIRSLHWSNPTEWGYYLTSLMAGTEKGLVTDYYFKAQVNKALNVMIDLQSDPQQNLKGQFYTAYYMKNEKTGEGDVKPYHTVEGMIPSIDNAFLTAALYVIKNYADDKGYVDISTKANAIIKAMDYRIYWVPSQHKFSMGIDMAHNDHLRHTDGRIVTWDNFGDETYIMLLMAYATGGINAEEFKKGLDALGFYGAKHTYTDGFELIVNPSGSDGSLFTYFMNGNFLDLPDMRFGKTASLPDAVAHMMWAKEKGYHRFGWSDLMTGGIIGADIQSGTPPAFTDYHTYPWSNYENPYIGPFNVLMPLGIATNKVDDYTPIIGKLQRICVYNAYQLSQTANYGRFGFVEAARADGDDSKFPGELYGTLDSYYNIGTLFNYLQNKEGKPNFRTYFHKDPNVAAAYAFQEEYFRERFPNIFMEAESFASTTGTFSTILNSKASGGQTLKGNGDATYNISLDAGVENPVIMLAYTDNVGGATVEVLVDGVSRANVSLDSSGYLGTFKKTEQLSIGSYLPKGSHTVTLKVVSGATNLELDYFIIFTGITVELLNDFAGALNSATWWTTDINPPPQYQLFLNNAQQHHEIFGHSMLKVVYNKANGDTLSIKQYGGFGAIIEPFDMSGYDYLAFWVYNDGSPLTIRVRLEDADGGAYETDWGGPDPSMKTPAADWENLVVDLTRAFGAVGINMHKIKNVIFMVDPSNTTSTGTFWLDDVTLLKAPKQAPIDVFEADNYGWSTSVNSAFTLALSSEAFHNDGDLDINSLGQQSLKVSWTSKNLLFHNIVYDVTHNSNAPVNRIGNLPDLTSYGNNTISMWVKSTTDNNFQISAKIFDVEPGLDADGQPTGGHGVDLGVATYTGAGEWQKLSWNYSGKAEAANAKVIYFFPFYNVADDGGSFYIDDVNLEVGTTQLPALQRLLKELDEIITQIENAQIDEEKILEAAAAAGAAYFIIKFLKDHLEGLKAKKDIVKAWKTTVTDWARKHPDTTFFGLLWLTRGVFLYETFTNAQTAFLTNEPLSAQSIQSLGYGLGYLAGLNLAFANLSRLMISQLLDKITNDKVLSYMDYSAGIPNSQRIFAFWPGAFFDLQLAQENGKTVKSETATHNMFKNIFDKIKNAIGENPDPNNNIIYGYPSDSRGIGLKIEKEEAQIFIDWLKANRPNIKFVWMHRKPVFYPLLGAKGGYRGRELKGGAIVDLLQWVSNDISGEGYRDIGTDKMWDDFLGTQTKDQIFGTAISPVSIENYFTIDAGDYPGPGAIRKMAEALGHADNRLYPIIAPDCIIGNIDDSLLTPLFGRARSEMRAVERVTWKIYGVAPIYGKFGGKVAISYDVWKKHPLPEQSILGEDLPMGMMFELEPATAPVNQRYKVGYANAIKLYEEGPTSLIAEKMTAIKWSYQDWTTSPMGGFNIRKFPYFTDKIPTVSGEYITPIKNYYSRWRIKSNLFARLGDPALLALVIVDIASKLNPGYISLNSAEQALMAYIASLVSLVVLPRVDAWYKEEGAKGVVKRVVMDTPVITAMMLEGIIDKSWHMLKGLEAYRKNDSVFNIPRPSLVEYQFKPKFFVSPVTIPGIVEGDREGWKRCVIGNTWKSLAVGQGVIWYSILTGEPLLAWYGLPFYLSWGGAAQTLTWAYARKDWKEVVNDIKGGGKEFYDWVKALMKKGYMKFVKSDATGIPGEAIKSTEVIAPTEVIEDTLQVTYDLKTGSHKLLYGEKEVGSIAYHLSDDSTILMVDTLTTSISADVPITAQEAARWLILESYKRIEETNLLKDTAPALNQIAAKTWLPAEVWSAINSLVTEGYLLFFGDPGDGYKYYWIQNSMRSASFTVSEKGVPSTNAVSGTQAAPTVNFGPPSAPVKVIDAGVFKGNKVRTSLQGDVIEFATDTDTYKIDTATLLQLAKNTYGVESLTFKLMQGDGTFKTAVLTSGRLTLNGMAYDLLTSEVVIKQFIPDENLAATSMRYIAEVNPMLDSGADALVTQSGGVNNVKFASFIRDIEKGDYAALFFSNDNKVRVSWAEIKKLFPSGIVIENGSGQPVGLVKLLENLNEFEVSGEVFMPESPAKKGVMNLDDIYRSYVKKLISGEELPKPQAVEFHVAPKQGKYVVIVKDVQVEAVKDVTGLIKTDTARADIIIEGNWKIKGKNVIISAQERLEPAGLKKIGYRALQIISTPAGTAGFVGTLNGIFITIKYNSDEYKSVDDLMGDVVGAAFDTGAWTVSSVALNRLSATMAVRGVSLGIAGGTVLAIPFMVAAESVHTYAKEFYFQWQAGTAIDHTPIYLSTSYETVYRAWLAFLDSIRKNWLYAFSPYGSGVRDTIEKKITDAIQEKWLKEDAEGQEAQRAIDELNKPYWRSKEQFDALVAKAKKADDHEFLASQIAKLYGAEYQKKIVDPILNGLSWEAGLELYDEYGWMGLDRRRGMEAYAEGGGYPFDPNNPLANSTPPPLDQTSVFSTAVQNAATKIKDVLMRNTYDLWYSYANGSNTVIPNMAFPLNPLLWNIVTLPAVETYLGYTPSLDDVFDWTLAEVLSTKGNLNSHLDGSWNSWIIKQESRRHLYNTSLSRWLDIRSAMLTLDALFAQLSIADFLSYGLYSSVLPNTDFEYASPEYTQGYTYRIAPPQTTYTLPNEVVFNGVKYYWDVKANNLISGESLPSAKWGFIGQ